MDDTVSISVEADVAALLNKTVTEGEFASVSDAIRSALIEFRDRRDDLLGYTPEQIRRLWDEGIASGPGSELDPEAIKREVRHRIGSSRLET